MNPQAELVLPYFVGVWIALTILSFGYHFFCRNAALKRLLHAPLVIFSCVLFSVFGWLMGFRNVYFALPVAGLAYLMIRNARYCDACGASQFLQGPFTPPAFCERCRAPLDPPRKA